MSLSLNLATEVAVLYELGVLARIGVLIGMNGGAVCV